MQKKINTPADYINDFFCISQDKILYDRDKLTFDSPESFITADLQCSFELWQILRD